MELLVIMIYILEGDRVYENFIKLENNLIAEIPKPIYK